LAAERELSEVLALDDPARPKCELSQEGERGRAAFIVFVDRTHRRSIAHPWNRCFKPMRL
jgi:hypothetical protein